MFCSVNVNEAGGAEIFREAGIESYPSFAAYLYGESSFVLDANVENVEEKLESRVVYLLVHKLP
jgi:hypothetical protein